LEDVYVTGMLAKSCGFQVVSTPGKDKIK